jgi:nucleotide-binding universal stress UspA family protein
MELNGPFSRILVPTDFSSGSQKAWRLAQRVARRVGAELVLLHVLPLTPVDVEARLQQEERRAAVRAAQANHQLGIPRADTTPIPPTPRVFEGPLTGEHLKNFSSYGREFADKLEEWADAARAGGSKVHTVLRVGVPYREVVNAAEDERCDLILLATHGRGEIHRLLVGSVADRVIRMARCPVMTVKEA